jgi:hypothetical protein
VWVKPNQVNTPIDKKILKPETVTVTDPRHPLYDQTFPLLHIKNKQELVLSCHVQITPGVNRLVPLNLTDLATTPVDVFPAPLHISSVQNLVRIYRRIVAQIEMEKGNGAGNQLQESDHAANGMDDAQPEAATSGVTDHSVHLPADGDPTSGGKA